MEYEIKIELIKPKKECAIIWSLDKKKFMDGVRGIVERIGDCLENEAIGNEAV